MKIKTLEVSDGFQFLLRDEDLHAAKLRLQARQRNEKKHGYDKTNSRRKFTVTREDTEDRRFNPEKAGRYHRYSVRVDYTPATELDFWLVDPEVMHIDTDGDLPKSDRQVSVTPSDLRYFRQPWSYHEGWMYIKPDYVIEPRFTVGLQIMGTLHDDAQINRLQDLVDRLYMPKKIGENEYHTEYGYGSAVGGSHPTIITSTNFKGDITPETEKKIMAHYEAVKIFALEHEVTTGFRDEERGKTWAELEHNRGGDMLAGIKKSNAARASFYAPSTRVDTSHPVSDFPRQSLEYRDGKYETRLQVQSFGLTVFSDWFYDI